MKTDRVGAASQTHGSSFSLVLSGNPDWQIKNKPVSLRQDRGVLVPCRSKGRRTLDSLFRQHNRLCLSLPWFGQDQLCSLHLRQNCPEALNRACKKAGQKSPHRGPGSRTFSLTSENREQHCGEWASVAKHMKWSGFLMAALQGSLRGLIHNFMPAVNGITKHTCSRKLVTVKQPESYFTVIPETTGSE